jgi:hypothetical protein
MNYMTPPHLLVSSFLPVESLYNFVLLFVSFYIPELSDTDLLNYENLQCNAGNNLGANLGAPCRMILGSRQLVTF